MLITRSALDEFFADGAHGLCIGHEIREGEGNIIALLVCRDCKVYRKVCVLTESGPLSVLKGFK